MQSYVARTPVAMHERNAHGAGMSQSNSLIVLFSGTGKTGRRIAQRLAARGAPFRVAARSTTPAFDWNDAATWDAALAGATAIYLAYPPDLSAPTAATHIDALVRRAIAAGVTRIVLLSGRGEPSVLPAEQAVRDAGVAFTILRCAWFAQNFSESYLRDPVLAGDIAFPGGDTAEPFLDAEDIADVAAAALTEPGHDGEIYELTGPRLLTFTDVARELSAALGRTVHYTPVSAPAYADALAPHLGVETAHGLASLFAYLLDGHNAHLTDGVQRALGRPARDFRDYLRAAVASGDFAA